nr:hypothetical protein [Tanacetum cinerariifolium]
MHPNKGNIESIDADEDITLVNVETQEKVADMDDELQGRITQEDVSAATKDVSAAEPTVFDDKEVTMTMAQTLARDKQEKDDLERAKVLQQQYDDKEENIDWNLVAEKVQERHLDNIKKGMTYDMVRPIFEREYKKVQIMFKPDKDVEEPKKKRVAEETLL